MVKFWVMMRLAHQKTSSSSGRLPRLAYYRRPMLSFRETPERIKPVGLIPIRLRSFSTQPAKYDVCVLRGQMPV
jgi:hypothetical protein